MRSMLCCFFFCRAMFYWPCVSLFFAYMCDAALYSKNCLLWAFFFFYSFNKTLSSALSSLFSLSHSFISFNLFLFWPPPHLLLRLALPLPFLIDLGGLWSKVNSCKKTSFNRKSCPLQSQRFYCNQLIHIGILEIYSQYVQKFEYWHKYNCIAVFLFHRHWC